MDGMRALCLVGLLTATLSARAAQPPEIPIAPDVTFVIAVSNAAAPEQARSLDHIAQGDYETVVTHGNPRGSCELAPAGSGVHVDGFACTEREHRAGPIAGSRA